MEQLIRPEIQQAIGYLKKMAVDPMLHSDDGWRFAWAVCKMRRNHPMFDILTLVASPMTYEAGWRNYTAEQYAKAVEILEHAASRKRVTKKLLQSATKKLEEVGFRTFPFEVVA